MSIPLAAAMRQATLGQWAYGVGGGVLVGAAGLFAADAIPKGAYVVYAIAFAFCVALALRHERSDGARSAWPALAAFVWLLIATVGPVASPGV